ncbi:hypothetical protein HJFPF1_08708 [Paramyrothecium foliicola]|nr:hypothetical protein HJFPF1_08708 [Paramyrothecium foliicola]
MQSPPKKAIASSDFFRVIVADNQSFTIHSALLAHQSAPLHTLVNGNFEEATKGEVLWEDIDEMTFLSFWEYVYTGNYTPSESLKNYTAFESTAPPEPEPTKGYWEAPEQAEEPPADDFWTSFGSELSREKSSTRKEKLKLAKLAKRKKRFEEFEHLKLVELPRRRNEWSSEPDGVPKSHGETFVHHAKVYVLADRYDVTGLLNISFEKLHQALADYVISEENVGDIVTLLYFCFQETQNVPEKLQEVVAHFAACNVEDLWKSSDFQDLVESCGSFLRILMDKMITRLD